MNRANKVVMYLDDAWLGQLSAWLEFAEDVDGEICRVVSVKPIEVGDEYVNRYEDSNAN